MNTRQYIFFFIPALIWGSTWYVITFQLGSVNPLQSVAYRFMLAGLILLLFCIITQKSLKFSLKEHGLMALLGAILFGFNYWCVYQAESMLTSGVVAVIFSLIIFFNIFFNALFLKGKIKKEILFAALLGVSGTAMLFKNEFDSFNIFKNGYLAIVYCFAGMTLASLGNILSAYQQRKKIPVIQANAFGMTYGSIIMFISVLMTGEPLTFSFDFSYTASLFYLVIFGSVIAFSAYLKLLGEIGPDRSAYIALITPVIALIISTIFEDYRWQLPAMVGTALLFAGNYIVLKIKHN